MVDPWPRQRGERRGERTAKRGHNSPMDEFSAPLLHEDADLIAVAKPEGIAAVPERDLAVDSLWRRLEVTRGERLWAVHRLDKEVSGLILFARHAAAHRALSLAFERRDTTKTYVALLQGVVAGTAGTVDAPIAQFGSGRMGVRADGKPSRSDWRLLQRFPRHSLVELQPRTGRRHQLRVHCYHLGHPIAGDSRYGDPAQQRGTARLMLHAWRLRLPHPSGGELALEADWPASFREVLNALVTPTGPTLARSSTESSP
jgi:RluA family pseudouridine synthase